MTAWVSTGVRVRTGLSRTGHPSFARQGVGTAFHPVRKPFVGTTIPPEIDVPKGTGLGGAQGMRSAFEPPLAKHLVGSDVDANSSPLQVWEGTVIAVDRAAGVMQVLLDAKIGNVPRHTGEIELEWVDEQDFDLVRPGAVFYLTLFKRTKPSIENAQELRFRRRPSWSVTQLKQIEKDAEVLLSKMKPLPIAE